MARFAGFVDERTGGMCVPVKGPVWLVVLRGPIALWDLLRNCLIMQ